MKPFNPTPLPPPGIDYLSLMPTVGKANRAIATFDGLLFGIPNPSILLAPMTTQEAVLSSKIEGTQAEFQDVLKFDAGETPDEESRRDDVYEIINYRKALILGERLLSELPFCLRTMLKLHEVLMDSVRGHDKRRGNIRTVQNWIGHPGSTIEEALFVPPDPLVLREHLSQWESYWHEDAPDPLIQLAIIHAQFEILHPFIDGNGRLGRMVIPLFLFEKKILHRPCFYLSAYFEKNRTEYIHRLRNLGQPNSWTEWCSFFVGAIQAQAIESTKKAKAIQGLYDQLKSRVIDLTHSQFAIPLLDFLFERPVFRSSEVAKLDHMPSTPMVTHLINLLKGEGILKVLRKSAGRRPQLLAFPDLVNLCEGREVI